jgi:hypothetical protein
MAAISTFKTTTFVNIKIDKKISSLQIYMYSAKLYCKGAQPTTASVLTPQSSSNSSKAASVWLNSITKNLWIGWYGNTNISRTLFAEENPF